MIDGATHARIDRGLLVFLGVARNDDETMAAALADKVLKLRVFPDADKPMNTSVQDLGGELLVVSQFTLAADTSRGNRPGFSTAAAPELAEPLYERFVAELTARGARVQTGRFGADMQVSLTNDGPVTFILEK